MHEDGQPIESALAAFAQRSNTTASNESLRDAMTLCIERGLDRLPLPGAGQTLARWQTLANVAGVDLALLKLYEGHTDALAILGELCTGPLDILSTFERGTWGVWAAEPPGARVTLSQRKGTEVRLNGHKAWCSGAQSIDYALITAWTEDQRPQLVAVQLNQAGVSFDERNWQAVGMSGTASVDVHLKNAIGYCVGDHGDYLSRPGFWHGGGGIAAAWYGAAVALGRALREQRRQGRPDPHGDAHLGAVDAALCGAAAALRKCALWIDAHPLADARLQVQRVRAQVEMAVERVCGHVGRALGATPFCRDAHFARLATDLPVFIRQSHAERDLAQLGKLVAASDSEGWSL